MFSFYRINGEEMKGISTVLMDAPSLMDCHLNMVGRFEFSMILRAMLSVVFNHFHQGHPWR